MEKTQDIKNMIAKTFQYLLNDIDGEMMTKLIDSIEVKGYKSGEIVVKEGDSGEDFYIIYQGKVKIQKGEEEMDILSEGDFFGEIALLYNTQRVASAIATGDVVCLVLSQDDFSNLLNENVEFKKYIEMSADIRKDV